MDFFVIIFMVIAALHLGWTAREIWAKITVKRLENELSDNLEKLQEHYVKNYVNIKMQKMNDTIYVYDMKDESFICQGKTKEEIVELFNKKHPDKNALIHEGGELWKQL